MGSFALRDKTMSYQMYEGPPKKSPTQLDPWNLPPDIVLTSLNRLLKIIKLSHVPDTTWLSHVI